MSLLSRFVIAFLPRTKRLFISWLQSPSAVILEPKKTESVTVLIVSPSICHEVIYLVKTMVFQTIMYGCESWTIKKAECQRIDAFEL